MYRVSHIAVLLPLYLLMLLGFSGALSAQARLGHSDNIPKQVWADLISYRDGFNLWQLFDFCSDRHGMMWVAGQIGLARFSGQNFQYYLPTDSIHQQGLGHGPYLSLDTDMQQRLWVSGYSGVYFFDEIRDSFCLIESPEHGRWSSVRRQIAFDNSKHKLWLVEKNGLYVLDMTTQQWHKTSVDSAENPNTLLVTESGRLFVAGDSGSFLYDPASNAVVKRYDHAKVAYESNDGTIWIGTWRNGLRRIDPHTYEQQIYFPPGDYLPGVYGEAITCLSTAPALTGNNILWCGTSENGFFFFDMEQRVFTGALNQDERKTTGLPGYTATSLYSDNSGVLWIGMEGITRIAPYRQQLLATRILGMKVKDDKEVYINKIVMDRQRPNHQWMTLNYYGLVSYNTAKKEVEKWWFYPQGSPVLKRERNYRATMEYDRQNRLWASTEHGFMVVEKDRSHREVKIPKYNNAQTAVHRFGFDADNRCWMATELGLCSYKLGQQIVEHPIAGSESSNSLTDMNMTPTGLWLASKAGVHFYDFSSHRYSSYLLPAETHDTEQNANHFNCVLTTQKGEVFALNQIGLVTLRHGQLQQLCKIPGAPYSHMRAMIEDKDGFLWIVVFSHLYKVNSRSGTIIGKFNASGGYFQQLDTDLVYLSGYNSTITFDPATLAHFTHTQKPVLTHLKVYDKRLPVDFDQAVAQQLRLSWRQNALTFEYDCPDFTSFMETSFEVMLEGYDTEWKPQGKKRSITYTNLAHGDYVFRVRATNLAGYKHPEDAIVRFHIEPPFWETWWFRSSILSILVVTLYLFFRLRIKAVQAEEAQKTELYRFKAETEMRALRAQMNPHFIFNCMNTIEAFIVEKRDDEATAFLQKFSKLIRSVLENAQHDSVSLSLELEVLESYIQLEQIRASHRWAYSIDMSPEIDTEKVQILPLILQPFAENAILHGLYHRRTKGGLLLIELSQNNTGELRISICDNGVGRAVTATKSKHLPHKKKSLGIQFSTERVHKLNPSNSLPLRYNVQITDANIDQPDITGTCVLITLPLSTNKDIRP